MDVIMLEEWIGLRVKITAHPNPKLLGLEGRVVDETLNTISILAGNSERKVVPKKGARAKVLGTKKELELSKAIVRPEERTKKLYKKV